MMAALLQDVAGLDRELVRRRGLAEYVRLAWPVVRPERYSHNWHIEVICSELEAVFRRETRKLVICVPPGSMKTLLTGVFYPSWQWTLEPSKRTIHTTYGSNLSLDAARMHRDMVTSDWFKERWPHVAITSENVRAAAWFENTKKGSRFSGSVGGEVTGRHAHDLFGDDLNKSIDALGVGSHAFDVSWNFWSTVLPTRQADPMTTARVCIGQRLHRDDVPGRWSREDPGVRVVCLPMRAYRHDHPLRHPDDPRSEGELLWPARYGEAEVEDLEVTLGPTGAAAQLQQEPVPPGGQLIRAEYLEHRYTQLPAQLQRTLEGATPGAGEMWRAYCDATFKGKATSDWVVIQLWCAFEGRYYVVDQVRGQWGFRETKHWLRDFAARYPFLQAIKIEDAANAAALEDDMRREIPGLQTAPVDGGCLARTQQVEGIWSSGAVMLPASAPWLGGSDGFIAEHLSFDGMGTRHDDQVSTSSLALVDLTRSTRSGWASKWKKVKP